MTRAACHEAGQRDGLTPGSTDLVAGIACMSLEHGDHGDDASPVFRSGTNDAFLDWCAGAEDHNPSARENQSDSGRTRCHVPVSECSNELERGHDGLSLPSETALQLNVALTPHRTEAMGDGKIGLIVSSVRPTLVVVSLLNCSACLDHGALRLSATLVYADDGQPVPSKQGETPLSGEVSKELSSSEVSCTLRLHVASLSYHHGRRTFSIRVAATRSHPCSGASEPRLTSSVPIEARSGEFRAVARLPDRPIASSARGTKASSSATAHPGRHHPYGHITCAATPSCPVLPHYYVLDELDELDELRALNELDGHAGGMRADDEPSNRMPLVGVHGTDAAQVVLPYESQLPAMGNQLPVAEVMPGARQHAHQQSPAVDPCPTTSDLKDWLEEHARMLRFAFAQTQRIQGMVRELQQQREQSGEQRVAQLVAQAD